MTTTSRAAITEMVREKFGDKDFDQVIGQPTSASIQLLITQLAEVASSFPTRQWRGNHGCLALVLNEAEARATTGITDLDCGPQGEPAAINPNITDETKGRELLTMQQEQKTVRQEFDLQVAVVSCGVTVIVSVVDEQYLEEKKKEYVGYNDETIHSLLDHIRTWAIVTNKEKMEAKAHFEAPWSDAPDQHITAFARQLDKRQRDCLRINAPVSDSDKVNRFVSSMYDSTLFEAKFLEEWEASVDQSWTVTRDLFTKEYGVVTRATNREAQRSGYESADALRERRPPPSIRTAATISEGAAISKGAANEYDVMAEYAATLEEQVTALQTLDGAQSVVSDFASSASTVNADSTLLKEMRAERKEQAVQMKQLTALVSAMKVPSAPADPTPRDRPRRSKSKKPIRTCANCHKTWVTHEDDECMELEKNADKRYAGWKSCL